MVEVREDERGNVVLALSGAFDNSSLAELASLARRQPSALQVVIDLSLAASISEEALGGLLNMLPQFGSPTIHVGQPHQEPLLKHLAEAIDERCEEQGATD